MSFFKHNLGLKLLALGLALALWLFVQREDATLLQLNVPLTVDNVPADVVALPSVSQVLVDITGPRAYVSRVSPSGVRAYVDGGHRVPGRFKAEVKVELPAAVRSFVRARAEGGAVQVTVEPRDAREVPVEARWSGAPGEGFAWGPPRIQPSVVKVTGGATAVSLVRKALVRLPGEGAVVDDAFVPLPVDSREKPVGDVVAEPGSVRVYAELGQAMLRRQAYVLPETTGRPTAGMRVASLTSEPQAVMLVGSAQSLNGVSTVRTRALSIQGLSASATKAVAVEAPPGATAFPPRVSVRVQLSPAAR